MLELKKTADGVLINVVSQPRSKRTRVVDFHNGAVKIAVSEPLQAGRANEVILRLLSEILKTPLRSLKLVSGPQYRKKTVLIENGDLESIRKLLESSIAQ